MKNNIITIKRNCTSMIVLIQKHKLKRSSLQVSFLFSLVSHS